MLRNYMAAESHVKCILFSFLLFLRFGVFTGNPFSCHFQLHFQFDFYLFTPKMIEN